MREWLRRIRGAIGIGTVWGVAGAALGAIGGAVGGLLVGLPLGYLAPVFGLYMGATTFLLGAGFSLALAFRGTRGTLGRPSLRRFAALGGMAGAALPFVWMLAPVGELLTDLTALPLAQFLGLLLGASAACAVVGSGLAAGTLAIARRAPGELAGDGPDENRLPSMTDEVVQSGVDTSRMTVL